MKKQKNRINKEEIAEDYCFVCKDGGLLRVCDYRDCLKGYHPLCVGKDDSFADAENRWTCSWHSCLICNKTSKFYCFLCTNAVCGTCIGASELVLVRGNKGFCNHCLKLARLIEEDADVDSEGGTVDFKDRDTYEFLFKEYYEEIKDKEGLTAEDVRTGLSLMKKNRNFSNGADLEVTEESEDYHLVISDYDGMDDVEKHKNKHKRKREKRQDCLKKTKVKSKNQEFIGWGSKALIEFLDSIGQDTSKMLSQRDATSIITQYINKNKLTHPDKKKMVICDARLQSVLRRRLVNRNRIYNLLSAHFTENFISSEEEDEEEAGYSSEKVGRSTLMVCMKNIKSNMEMKYTEKKVELNIQKSCFASITPKNIKLVYLKRTLVEELLREFESFERKLVGSFIKVKSNPNDYLQKNSHQLLQVTEIQRTSFCRETDEEVFLRASNWPTDISIRMLSDDDFSEEECEDFRRKVIDGLLRKPTVREFEEKAKSLHVDITKHWIARELVTLQNLIDRANEKGWRRELFAYIERRDLLQTPSEQSRLLQEVPEVIADIVDFKSDTVGSPETDKLTHETLPNLKTPEKACCNMGGNRTFCSGIGRGDSTGSSQQPLISSPKGQHVYVRQKRQNQNSPDKLKSVFPNAIAQGDSSRGLSPEKVPPESHHGLLQHEYAPEDEQKKLPEPSATEKISIANPEEDSKDQSSAYEAPGTLIQREGVQRPAAEEGRKPEAEVIGLSEDEGDGKFPSNTAQTNAAPEDVESYTWHCVSPRGERKGPFSLSVLKRWYGFSAYASKFKVWKVGQGPEQAVLLTEAIGKISPRCGGRDGICSES